VGETFHLSTGGGDRGEHNWEWGPFSDFAGCTYAGVSIRIFTNLEIRYNIRPMVRFWKIYIHILYIFIYVHV